MSECPESLFLVELFIFVNVLKLSPFLCDVAIRLIVLFIG